MDKPATESSFNYSQLCRLCMGAEVHMVHIFGDGNAMRTHSISSQILSITALEVSNGDGLPTRICQHCFEQLQLSFRFRQMSRSTNSVLRSKLVEPPYVEVEVKVEVNERDSPVGTQRFYESDEEPRGPGAVKLETRPPGALPLPPPPPPPPPVAVDESGSDPVEPLTDYISQEEIQQTKPAQPASKRGGVKSDLARVKRTRHHSFDRPRKLRATDSPRRFQCSQCTKCYVKRSTLTQHMRCHGERCVHICPVCDRAFLYASLLTEHARSHTGERPFRCAVCSKVFGHKNDFGKHLRTHTREKPFQCSFCDKHFSQKGHLGVHLRCHTGEKPYACPTCGKTFAYQNSLSLHVSSHLEDKPFVCAFCSKAFAGKKNLAKHVRYHTEKKAFVCPFCAKAFFYPGDLEAHKRKHTGEKPYQCTSCDRAFAQKKQFTAHAKSHAQET